MASRTQPNATGPATVDPNDFSNPEQWDKREVGFRPYFEADIGSSFAGVVQQKDLRDPDFVRYVIRALQDMTCFEGEKGADGKPQNPVSIKAGETFTVGNYKQIEGELDFYLWVLMTTGREIPFFAKVLSEGKVKSDPKKTVLKWELRAHPSVKGLLTEQFPKYQALLAQAMGDAPAMANGAAATA